MFRKLKNCRLAARHAFTLVEVLAAVILIAVGLLALVAGTAVLIRQTTDARLRAAALRTASNRLQTLGAAGCASSSGTSESRASREAWSAVTLPNGVLELTDSVWFTTSAGAHTLALRTRLPC